MRKFFIIHLVLFLIFATVAVAVFFGTGANPNSMGTMIPTIFSVFLLLATSINFLVFLPGVIRTRRIMTRGTETQARVTGVIDRGYSRGGEGPPTHNGFSVELEYTDKNGDKVTRVSRTVYATRAAADDIHRMRLVNIKYLGRHVEITDVAPTSGRGRKRIAFERIGEYHKSRDQIEHEEAVREKRAKMSRKDRRAANLADYGVTTRLVYWFGIAFVISWLAVIGLTIFLFVRHGESWQAGVSFAGIFVWGILGALLYTRLQIRQGSKLGQDPNAREMTGILVDVTILGHVGNKFTLRIQVDVDGYKPIAVIRDRVLENPLNIGDEVRVLFNPKRPNVCRLVLQ